MTPRSAADAYSRFDYMRVEVVDGLATVTMLTPEGPAYEDPFAHPMHAEIRDVFAPLSADPDVMAVILTGVGSTFFAGAGLEHTRDMLTGSFAAGVRGQVETRQIISNLLDFDKPLISAVNGAAIGPGAVLALLSDFVVATPAARFQDTHVRIGLPAGDGGTMLWPLFIGMARTRDLLLRGHPILAEEAYELGLVTELVAPAALLDTARTLAAKLMSFPQFAYRATRLGLNQWFRMSALFALDLPLGFELAAFSSPEFDEAINAAIAAQAARRGTER